MDQLATKGKKGNSEVCTVCENSTTECDSGSDDFVDCEKCGLTIHKICFNLLKIFQDFERRNEKFPFTILCSECRQFTGKDINEVQMVDSCEESDNFKNPFEIDCIVKVIVDHLNIQDLANVRLVNKLWNQNASRILSKESRQDQLGAYNVKRKNPDSAKLEDCLQIVKSSDQKKLMQKWVFELDTDEDEDVDQNLNSNHLNVFNQIATITKPTRVTIYTYNELKLKENTSFSTLWTNISENVANLSLDFEEITGLDSIQFCMPIFSKLKSIVVNNLLPKNYEFVKMIIENSPKLMSLTLSRHNDDDDLDLTPDDLTLDDYINKKSTYCALTEKSAQNLQILKLGRWTEFNFETFDMKLKTLSLHANCLRFLKFGKLKTFLTSQNDSLENLKFDFPIDELVRLDGIEGLETGQLDLPRLEKVQHFSLTFQIIGDGQVYNLDEEIWPVKPINLTGKFPNLKKISIGYCQSWALSFETGQNCHRGVTELVLKKWTDGDLTKLVELFPQIEVLKLKEFCFNPDDEKIYTKLDNLNGWSKSLKRIEISCEYYHLENFDFKKLVCLTNLERIKISQTKDLDPDGISSHFIYPGFKPLFKITTLTQVVIKDFKISKGIVEDLREKYPSLDYSFYSTCKSTDCASGDFVSCEKCGLSIHKNCFKLSGDLFKFFQDVERRNEKFPFTILCPECRQFSHEPIDKVQVVASCEGNGNLKNPFEIDCIVNVIVDHLNIQDLANVRLVNKLWNQNASRILSRESRQVKILKYNIKIKNPHSTDLEKCLQIVKSSEQTKLLKKWRFNMITPPELKVYNQILIITKPASVTINTYDKLKLKENTLFSTLLTNISENVVGLSLDFRKISGFDPNQFDMPKFSKLKSLAIETLLHENCEFMKMVIENSPKLVNLILYDCGPDLKLDDFITQKSKHCILNEKLAQNIQTLKIHNTNFNFDFEGILFQMKIKSLSLDSILPHDVKFVKLNTFLKSQNQSLGNLEIRLEISDFVSLDGIENVETEQMVLPRLENVQHFILAFVFEESETVCNTEEEIWPVQPIHLTGKFPNLKKITIKFCQSWALSFETGQNCHRGVTELVLKHWTDGDLIKLVELFPQVEILKLKKFSFYSFFEKKKYEKIYTQLDNLNGWSESLKRIEISCEYYHLENFDFEKLVCLSNLERIKISQAKGLGIAGISSHFIYPDFKPLYKIATLTQVVIKDFKISKGIVEDLRENYPSLDYSFYPK